MNKRIKALFGFNNQKHLLLILKGFRNTYLVKYKTDVKTLQYKYKFQATKEKNRESI